MRRAMGVVAVVAALLFTAPACGGGSETAATTTAPNTNTLPGGGAPGTTDEVAKYCDKVDELASLVAKGRSSSANFDAEVRALSDELKTLSNDAATSLTTNPGAAKKFGECSLAASKKIAESFQPG